jgi:hypothetical protein
MPPTATPASALAETRSLAESVDDGAAAASVHPSPGGASLAPGGSPSKVRVPAVLYVGLVRDRQRRGRVQVHAVNGHRFVAKHWNTVKRCAHCQQPLLGIGKQGYKCLGTPSAPYLLGKESTIDLPLSECGLRMHKKCHQSAAQCTGHMAATEA